MQRDADKSSDSGKQESGNEDGPLLTQPKNGAVAEVDEDSPRVAIDESEGGALLALSTTAMRLDKKVLANALRFVLLRRLGEAEVSTDYDVAALRDILATAAPPVDRPAGGRVVQRHEACHLASG